MRALLDLLIPLTLPRPIILADQNGSRLQQPYFTVKVRSSTGAPLVESKPDPQGAAVFHEHNLLRCEIQCLGRDAANLLRVLGVRMRMPSTSRNAQDLGLSISSVDQARDITALLQASQREERAMLEFNAYAVTSVSEVVSLIEHVVLNCPAEGGHQHVISSPDAATAPPIS